MMQNEYFRLCVKDTYLYLLKNITKSIHPIATLRVISSLNPFLRDMLMTAARPLDGSVHEARKRLDSLRAASRPRRSGQNV
jgi:hypothetical protein